MTTTIAALALALLVGLAAATLPPETAAQKRAREACDRDVEAILDFVDKNLVSGLTSLVTTVRINIPLNMTRCVALGRDQLRRVTSTLCDADHDYAVWCERPADEDVAKHTLHLWVSVLAPAADAPPCGCRIEAFDPPVGAK
jgi:hypothetical protein